MTATPQILEFGHSAQNPTDYDLLLAAIACRHKATMLHHDRNLAAVTGGFRQGSITPPATLN